MDKKRKFNDALSDVVELAGKKGNTLSFDDIHSAFNGIIDDDSMYEHIYKYLAENKITITGYISSPANRASKDNALEKQFIEMYKNDLSTIEVPDDSVQSSVLKNLLSGADVSSTLAEYHLHMVMDIISGYRNMGVTFGDLIQEGNLGLMEGILSYNGTDSLEEFRTHISSCIHNALKDAIDEQNGADRIGSHIADRANSLDHAATELAKDLEREPTLKELADYLSLSEEEVEKVMKISLDALTIEGEGAVGNEDVN